MQDFSIYIKFKPMVKLFYNDQVRLVAIFTEINNGNHIWEMLLEFWHVLYLVLHSYKFQLGKDIKLHTCLMLSVLHLKLFFNKNYLLYWLWSSLINREIPHFGIVFTACWPVQKKISSIPLVTFPVWYIFQLNHEVDSWTLLSHEFWIFLWSVF